jgi:hypothetical protein
MRKNLPERGDDEFLRAETARRNWRERVERSPPLGFAGDGTFLGYPDDGTCLKRPFTPKVIRT